MSIKSSPVGTDPFRAAVKPLGAEPEKNFHDLSGTGLEGRITTSIRAVLGDDLPADVEGTVTITAKTFKPEDLWGVVFREGLKHADLSGVVVEVGAGGGWNAIFSLIHHPDIEKMIIADVEEDVIAVADENVRAVSGIPLCKFEALLGKSDLLKLFRDKYGTGEIDTVIACIPQIRIPAQGSDLLDKAAHYYDGPVPDGFQNFDKFNLTLCARLLAEARLHLKPGHGKAILNLAGRVDFDVLVDMYHQNGYSNVRVLYEQVITQHIETKLHDLIEEEKRHGVEFNFYTSPTCDGERVSAAAAQALIDRGEPVYHKLYVMEGTFSGIN